MDIRELYLYTQDMSVLYVEDNKNLLSAKMEIFKEIFQNADSAENGLIGLKKYKKNRYDIVITDLNMPYMNGLEMIDHVLKIDANQAIIIVSAYLKTEYISKLSKFKKIDFLTKPVGGDELIRSIYEVVKPIKKLAV